MLRRAVHHGSIASPLHALPALVEGWKFSLGRDAFNLGSETRVGLETSPRLLVFATPMRLHIIKVIDPQLRLIPWHLPRDHLVLKLTEAALHIHVLFRKVDILFVLLISAQRLDLDVFTGEFPKELTNGGTGGRCLLA